MIVDVQSTLMNVNYDDDELGTFKFLWFFIAKSLICASCRRECDSLVFRFMTSDTNNASSVFYIFVVGTVMRNVSELNFIHSNNCIEGICIGLVTSIQ